MRFAELEPPSQSLVIAVIGSIFLLPLGHRLLDLQLMDHIEYLAYPLLGFSMFWYVFACKKFYEVIKLKVIAWNFTIWFFFELSIMIALPTTMYYLVGKPDWKTALGYWIASGLFMAFSIFMVFIGDKLKIGVPSK